MAINLYSDKDTPEILDVLRDIRDFMELSVTQTGQKSVAASQPVAVATDGNPIPVSLLDGASNGVISALNGSIIINTAGKAMITIQVIGTFSATLTPQVSLDGTNWVSPGINNPLNDITSSGPVSGISTVGFFSMSIAGTAYLRLICTSYSSGTAFINLRTSSANDSNDGIVVIPGISIGSVGYSVSQKTALSVSVVKASYGSLYGFNIVNGAAATTYIQFFDSASSPTIGSSVLFAMGFVSASATTMMFPFPLNFINGISIGAATTAGGAISPLTAPDLSLFYK